MGVIVSGALRFFLGSTLGNVVGIALAVGLAFLGFQGWLLLHDREVARSARAKVVRQMLTATASEAERRESELRKLARDTEQRANEIEADNVRLQMTLVEVTHASASHDNRLCFAPDQLRRLQPFGGVDRREAGGAGGSRKGGSRPALAPPLPPSRPTGLRP